MYIDILISESRARASRIYNTTVVSPNILLGAAARIHEIDERGRKRSTCDRTNESRSYPDDGHGRTDSEPKRRELEREGTTRAPESTDEARLIAAREGGRKRRRVGEVEAATAAARRSCVFAGFRRDRATGPSALPPSSSQSTLDDSTGTRERITQHLPSLVYLSSRWLSQGSGASECPTLARV